MEQDDSHDLEIKQMYYSFHIGCILRQNFIFSGKIEVDMFIFIVHPSPSLLDLDLSFLSFFLLTSLMNILTCARVECLERDRDDGMSACCTASPIVC